MLTEQKMKASGEGVCLQPHSKSQKREHEGAPGLDPCKPIPVWVCALGWPKALPQPQLN
jgi:hypothetical protein